MSEISYAFDPWSPEVLENPYPYYAELRKNNAVCEIPAPNCWVATRYEDVRTVTNDFKRFSVREGLSVRPGDHQGGNVLVENDPPIHTKSRRALQPFFTPKAMEAWETRVQEIADQLVDMLLGRGSADLKTVVADPLVSLVMIELLGLPDNPELRKVYPYWSRRVMEDVDRRPGDPDVEPLHETLTDAYEWFSDLLAERRNMSLLETHQDLTAQLLTTAISAGDDEQVNIHTDEQVNQIALTVLAAGLANTAEMLCFGALAFCQDPEQWELFKSDPDGFAVAAVEESVRWGSPAHCVYREVLEDVELSGVVVPKGARMMTLWGSANHDEEAFEDPERFDLHRDNDRKHLGWGVGVHRCIGEHIARLEGVAFFRALGRKVDEIELDGSFTPYMTSAVRGFTNLPVKVSG